ncbi:MAG: DUF2878 domain-containing protein [Acidobacteria bacterium]|nr:DUF2878 domain-containing protein [Acidobacteriota bacterium]
MRHSGLINYALYQAGWFACVLGAASGHPWMGCLIAVMLIAAHLSLSSERAIDVRLVVCAAAVGLGIETLQIAAGTYRFTSGTVSTALPPLWLVAMWAQFATTFRFSLRRIITRPLHAAIFGAAGGPLAFLAGERLGAVTLLPPLAHSLLRLSVGWAIALVVLSEVMRRIVPDADAGGPRTAPDACYTDPV